MKISHNYRYRTISKYLGQNILEIGCGDGDMLEFLQKRGHTVYGIETTKQKAPYIFNGTLEQTKFENNQFDLVMLFNVFEHIPDSQGTLKEIRRILKPTGYLIIEVPNPRSIDVLFKSLRKLIYHPKHCSVLTARQLIKMAKEEGFKKIDIEFSFPFSLYKLIKRRNTTLKHKQEDKHVKISQPSEIKPTPKFYRFIKRILRGMRVTIVFQ